MAAALVLLQRSASQLDTALFGALPELGERPLVVVPTGALQSLPWSTLPSCAGRPVAVSPSAALWYAAMRAPARPLRQVAVIAGPRLPGAESEAKAVAAIYGTTALTGPDATVNAVVAALGRADLAHLATHGSVCVPNPLFSSLGFADGPLMVYDLQRLERVPATVVLAACDSGRHVVPPGDELLGLGMTFLAQGAKQLVGSVVAVPDSETAPLMVELHRQHVAGYPVAEALARAQHRLAGGDPAELAAAAGFVCIGAGLTLGVRQPVPAP
jgi:CHAT domain-containing protein